MDIEPFIAEIIANPDDDAARLIFSDYLEEHGDPRAELIRLQFEMAELAYWDPKRAKLRKRELALLKEYGGFGRTPIGVQPLGSRGGFLDAVEVTVARFLRLHEEIFAKAPIREVALRSKSTRFAQLGTCEGTSHIRRLTLKRTQATDEQLVELFRSPRLENLSGLDLRQHATGARVVRAIAASPHLAGLQELRLPGVQGGDVVAALAESHTLTKLRQLAIWRHSGSESLSRIAHAANFSGLTSLSYAGMAGSSEVTELINSPGMIGLESLVLSGQIGTVGSSEAAFDSTRAHESIRNLTIAGGCEDKCIPGLLRTFPNLRVLDLSHGSVREAGAVAIANHPSLEQLDRLVLTRNRIPFAGIKAIAESSYRRKGMKLLLRGNALGRRDVTKLQDAYGRSFGSLGKPRDYGMGMRLW